MLSISTILLFGAILVQLAAAAILFKDAIKSPDNSQQWMDILMYLTYAASFLAIAFSLQLFRVMFIGFFLVMSSKAAKVVLNQIY